MSVIIKQQDQIEVYSVDDFLNTHSEHLINEDQIPR